MKLSIIFLLAACFDANAKGYAQKVSLSVKDASIAKVFNEIQRQTGYTFVYTESLLQKAKKVSITTNDASVEEVLDLCFLDQPLTYTILNRIIIIKDREAPKKGDNAIILSPPIPVKGKITNERGEPLAGATITEKGTSNAVTTKEDGSFSIEVENAQSVLSISFVGYKAKEITIGNESTVAVKLSQANRDIEEVVVNTGYGLQKKSVVTGAISSVKAKDLENVPSGRVEQSLQGRVSGITVAQNSGQPGSASTIRIRGITTFGDNNSPLWVVDGVVIDPNGIGFLNQSDIESIEVLKDASSAAIYGTRAATGVILITTKKGKAGKLTVGYSGFYGISSPAKKLKLLNASQYATVANEKSVNDGGSPVYDDPSALGAGTDWQKAIFNKSAKRHVHELSLSGGNDRSVFYLSAGIQEQEGIVTSDISKYSRKGIRLNSTHKISKIFTFGETVGYSHEKSTGLGNTNSEYGGPLSSAINLDPLTPLVVTDPAVANALPYTNGKYPVRDGRGNPYGISEKVGQEMTNPLAYIQTRLGGYDWADNFVGNAFIEAAIRKDIKIKSTVAGKLANWGNQQFTPAYFLSATNLVDTNRYSKSSNNSFNWNIENTITYTKSIDKHNFTVLLGQAAYVEGIGGGLNITIKDLPITSYQDASFNFDIPQTKRSAGYYDIIQHKLSSLFARLNYDFNEKYLFTGIIRRDGSSRFGSNNKYGVFPGFSAGWVVSKENFWKPNNVIDRVKIRGGYGKTGNDGIGDFGYLPIVGGGYNAPFGSGDAINIGYAPISLANPDLHWEETTSTDIGFEAILFKSVSLNVNYYSKKTSGILRPIPIPGYVGVSNNPSGNIADMNNKGLEVELGYRKKLGPVNFSANGNISYLKNEVTRVDVDADFITGGASFQNFGPITRVQVGESYNAFFGARTSGIFQNQDDINAYINKDGGLIQPNAKPGDFRWVDINGDGKITLDDKDKEFLGTSLPKYTFGLTLNADYKGFDLMVFAQGAAGNKIFQGLRRLDIGNANYQTSILNRWSGEGTSYDYPRLSNSDPNYNFGKMSDFYLEKGDYVRVKLVQLGYSLPGNILNKIRASKLRVYITAENLFTITGYTGYDPEIGGGVFGVDKGVYPQARSFIGGVQLQF